MKQKIFYGVLIIAGIGFFAAAPNNNNSNEAGTCCQANALKCKKKTPGKPEPGIAWLNPFMTSI
jgi:hypothetical protein